MVAVVSRVAREIGKMDLFLFYLRIEKDVSVEDISEITGFTHDQVNLRLKGIYDRIKQLLA